MIQLLFLFTGCPSRKSLQICQPAQCFHKFRVIGSFQLHPACAKLPKIPFGAFSRGNVEVIGIHNLMWRHQNNRLWLKLTNPARSLVISINGTLNLFFFSFSHIRYNQRRMRNHNCC